MKRLTKTEKELRATVTKLTRTIANQRAALEELRQLVTRLALASAVLTQMSEPPNGLDVTPDNVIPFRPLTT